MRRADRVSLALLLALVALLLAWTLLATLVAPAVIERAYRGTSLPVLNHLITGQASHPLEAYLTEWHRIAVRTELFVLAGGLFVIVGSRPEVRRFLAVTFGSEPARLSAVTLVAWGVTWVVITFLVQGDLLWKFDRGIWGAEHEGAFNLWILGWVYHALTTDPLALFDANIFYPARDTLALSNHRIADQLFFAPARVLTGSPIVAYNVVMTAQFVFTALTAALLGFYLFGSWRAAALAGTMFSFSPARLAHLDQSSLISAAWTPLTLLFLDRFLASRSWRHLLGFALSLALQFLASFYLGYFLLMVVLVWAAGRTIACPREVARLETAIKGGIGLLLAALLVIPFARPYLRVRAEYSALEVPLEFLERASAEGVVSYFAIRPGTLLYRGLLAPSQSGLVWEKWLFPGFLCLGLAILALAVSPRALAGSRARIWMLGAVVGTAFLLSLGPTIHLAGRAVASPYRVLLWLVPGFSSMRVPARLGITVALGLALLAAPGYRWLEERLASRRSCRAGVFALTLAAVVTESMLYPGRVPVLPTPAEIPAEYRRLATNGEGALLELPIRVPPETSGDRFRDLLQETRYMYYSLYHGRPLVNGYSGHRPRTVADVMERVSALTSPESFRYLAAIGVRYILVRPDDRRHARIAALPNGGATGSVTRFPHGTLLLTLPALAPAGDVVVRVLTPERWPSAGEHYLGVLFANPGDSYWVNPGQRACQVALAWKAVTGQTLSAERSLVLPPVALAPGEMQERRVRARAPGTAGGVRLDSTVICRGAGSARHQWAAEHQLTLQPTPGSDDEVTIDLDAAYRGDYVPPVACVECPHVFRLHVQNTGSLLWKAGGRVHVGVQWTDAGGAHRLEHRLPLDRDIYPGQEAVIGGTIRAPSGPGVYDLRLGVIRGTRTPLDWRTTPRRVVVTVE
jgi:hypothetical protein